MVPQPTILLVDDETAVLRGLTRALRVLRPHWHVHVADSGGEALKHLRQNRYDLMVTDLEMPGIDGVHLLNRAKREFPDVVRLVHSSKLSSPDGPDLRLLAVEALAKPARPADLVRAIERALSTSAAELRHAR